MPVLTDTNIREMLISSGDIKDDSRIVIHPYDEDSLTPVGYDLRVGMFYKSSADQHPISLSPSESVILAPGSTTNIRTLEWLAMPQDKSCTGLICSKVSLVSQGLSHISTTVDPDWVGNLSISVHNHSDKVIELKVGRRFCTVVFLKNVSPATKVCGFPPGRTDTLVSAITTEQRIANARRGSLKKWALAVMASLLAIVLSVVMYLVQTQNLTDNNIRALISSAAIISPTISAILAALLTKLLSSK